MTSRKKENFSISPAPAAFGRTDIGRVRRRNEDDFYCNAAAGTFAVADGLGGLKHGDVASQTAVETLAKIADETPAGEPLASEIIFARINAAVLAAVPSGTFGQITGGTTLTVAQIVSGNQLRISHVGDSGVFLFPAGGGAKQLTRDHNIAGEKLAQYGEAIISEITERDRNTLTQCLGQTEPLEIETLEVPFVAGDRILLYTDGVTKVWTPAALEKIILPALTPAAAVNEIIAGGNARGAPDNLTAIAIFC